MDNLTLPPDEVIVALINRTNSATGLALTKDLVSFGPPSVATGGDYNTSVTVTAEAGSGYSGDDVFNYDRVHLTTDVGDAYTASAAERNLTFPVGDATTIAEIVLEFNARLGVNLTSVDFVDGPLPTFNGEPNEEQPVQIVATADSLVYRGSVMITLKAQDIPLADAIVVKRGAGLTYTPPA